ncbi:MAG TPA: hypothetical protein VMG34_05510 [Bacteroidota bacterium]|nr:hypothetical protein [Bacteroidota bacterium]
MKIALLYVASLTLSLEMFAQVRPDIPADSPEIEELLEGDSPSIAATPTLEELEYYRRHPVLLDAASFEELLRIPFLVPRCALRILHARDSLGILSLTDLDRLLQNEKHTLDLILPFVSFENPERSGSDQNRGEGSECSRVSTQGAQASQQGFVNVFREYDRVEYGSRETTGGLLYARDPGERYQDGFVSGYLGFQYQGALKRLILGDYSINAGEGLTLANYRSSSLGGDAVGQIKASGRSIVPHLSTNETHYLRGAAATVEVYPLDATIFVSYKPLDASLDTSTNVITSFYSSGLFRTAEELKKRDAGHESAEGGVVTIHLGPGESIGLASVHVGYDRRIDVSAPMLFDGTSITVTGLNGDFVAERWRVFGEIAVSNPGSTAGNVGTAFEVSKRLSLGLGVRSYAQGYANPLAFAFGEQGGAAEGESGRYLGIELRATDGLKISGYHDEATLATPGSFPADVSDDILRGEFAVTSAVAVALQFRNRSRADEASPAEKDSANASAFSEKEQRNIRLSASVKTGKGVDLSGRVELGRVRRTDEGPVSLGLMTYLDASVALPRRSWRIVCRLIYFDAPSYEARLYEYETDVRGGFSMPALYGHGWRWYMLAAWKVNRTAELSVKYAETRKSASPDPPTDDPWGDSRSASATIQLDLVF